MTAASSKAVPQPTIKTIRTIKPVPAPVGGMAIHRLRDHISEEHLTSPARYTRWGVEYPVGETYLLIPWSNISYIEAYEPTSTSTTPSTSSKTSTTTPKKKTTKKKAAAPTPTPTSKPTSSDDA